MSRVERIPFWLPPLAFWLTFVSVGVLSLTPVDQLPPQALNIWDKAQHAAGFTALTLQASFAYPRERWRYWIGLSLYGAAIEVAQAASGWRHGDFQDWLADLIGVGIGVLVIFCWRQRWGPPAQ